MDRSPAILLPQQAQQAETAEFRIAPETLNQITHGFGFLLTIPASFFLMANLSPNADWIQWLGCASYAFSLVALYGASTLSHSFSDPDKRSYYRMWDQVCIFLLSAGSISPFAAVHLREGYWWMLPLASWGFALVGMIFRLRNEGKAVAILCYVILGWLPVLSLSRIAAVSHAEGLLLVLGGGASYTIGTLFLANDHKQPWFHAVWHILVIIGSGCHYYFHLKYAAMWNLAG